MNKNAAADRLSRYFSSFRKSEQVVVYNEAIQDVPLLVQALKIHLRAVASGKVFETYQLDRLGEWVGWCFPNHTQDLDRFLERELASSSRNPKKAEVFSFFNKGLAYGRSEARQAINAGSVTSGSKVSFEVVHPS